MGPKDGLSWWIIKLRISIKYPRNLHSTCPNNPNKPKTCPYNLENWLLKWFKCSLRSLMIWWLNIIKILAIGERKYLWVSAHNQYQKCWLLRILRKLKSLLRLKLPEEYNLFKEGQGFMETIGSLSKICDSELNLCYSIKVSIKRTQFILNL